MHKMGKVVAGMTMSLDGVVEDRDGGVGSLYYDFEAIHDAEFMQESIRTTGAVVMGRKSFAMGDPDLYAGNYEYQVPIFVLTHLAPEKHPKENEDLTFTFVSDGIESAVRQAKAAAGDKDVTMIGGASTIQQGLRAGLIDELHIDIMPVLLGGGLRLLENLDPEQVKLEKIHLSETADRTHLKFRVLKPASL
jgi:dihydrofolate reductase